MGRRWFLLGCGCNENRYCGVAHGAGLIPNEIQFPCRTRGMSGNNPCTKFPHSLYGPPFGDNCQLRPNRFCPACPLSSNRQHGCQNRFLTASNHWCNCSQNLCSASLPLKLAPPPPPRGRCFAGFSPLPKGGGRVGEGATELQQGLLWGRGALSGHVRSLGSCVACEGRHW